MDNLGTNLRNPKFFNNVSVPDTDSRGIELNIQGTNVAPNLMFDHTRLQYTVPVSSGSGEINFSNFINAEERSLHTLILNNSNLSISKVFKFSPSYIFLDENIANSSNQVTVSAGTVGIYFGSIIKGKMYLRESVESTL
jgi:hypothetical protein